MSKSKESGDLGELEVCRLVQCPNCKKDLMILPKNYPLFDVQCTGCSFRAQVKTNNSKPKDVIFGAGWDIMEKVLKSGYTVPPLIANFKWTERGVEKQEILFFPFIPKSNLTKRQLGPEARRANYKMFNYKGLLTLPYFPLFQK